jgi:hypothetical protein
MELNNSFYLYLDSSNRENPVSTNSNDCTFDLKKYGWVPSRVFVASLASFTIPLTVYNVTTENQTLRWTRGTARSATLPVGSYDTTTLTAAIKTAMDAVGDGNTYTVTYSSLTFKITVVANTNAFVFNFNNSDTPWKLMGFDNAATASSLTQVSDNAVDLSLPRELFVHIDGFARRPQLCNGTKPFDYLFHVLLGANSGTVVVRDIDLNQHVYLDSTGEFSTRFLYVKLYDGHGNLIEFNNSDWTMQIQFHYAESASDFREQKKRKISKIK